MINRLVKLTFRIEEVETFLQIFDEVKEKIIASDGCEKLNLLRDKNKKEILFTHSQWIDEEALEQYRRSDTFRSTWAKVKKLFSDKPEAWSTEIIVVAEKTNS